MVELRQSCNYLVPRGWDQGEVFRGARQLWDAEVAPGQAGQPAV